MAKPKKGVVPPQFLKYMKAKKAATPKRKAAPKRRTKKK